LTNFTYFICADWDLTFPDSITYIAPAKNLLHGYGFATQPRLPETMRTPVYPLFIVPFLAATSRLEPIVIVQHLINVALAIAIYLFARKRFESRLIALTAAMIFAIDSPTIHYANKVLTETLFTAVLFALFVLILPRGGQAPSPVLTGALAGLLILIRPLAIAYFVVLAIFTVRKRLVAFVAVALAFPLAFAIRNRIETGVFTVSSVAGVNTLLHRA